MTDNLESISEPPPRYSEIVPLKKQNKILSITHKVVDGDLIDIFDEIPDAIEQSRLPFPVLVPIGERYACLEGNHLVSPGGPVHCIVIETADISKTALALLKVSLRMTGLLLGSLSYIEQARYVRILYNIHIEDAGIIVNSNGGDRRSEAFNQQDGEHIQLHLARALDRSVFTIRIYLDHTRYLTLEAMNELARLGASKRFFIAACKLRTELLSQLPENSTDEEIVAEVSKKFLEWFSFYDAKTGEIIYPQDEPDVKEEFVQDNNQGNSGETKKDGVGTTPPIVSSDHEPQKKTIAAALTGQVAASSLSVIPGEEEHQDSLTEEENEEQNDVVNNAQNPGTNAPPHEIDDRGKEFIDDLNKRKDIAVDTFQRFIEIGKQLDNIGQMKPSPDQVRKEVRAIVAELLKLAAIPTDDFGTLSNEIVKGEV